MDTLISVVFSFRNEESNIPVAVTRTRDAIQAAGCDYELIFVDDDSSDSSATVLAGFHAADPRIKVVTMSRRFGVSECVLAGMAVARGDAVVYLDTDLQDPPELISEMIARWRDGADVVHTVRSHRLGEHPAKMWLTRQAYRLIQWTSTINLPVNAGDFKLLSRRAVDQLLALPESDPYLRGLVSWIGFSQAFVTYERQARHAGETHFPLFSRNPWKTAINGFISFSFTPLYAILAAGLAGLAIGVPLLLAGLMGVVFGGSGGLAAGALALLAWASLMAAIGLVGLYIVRIYKDVRGRPRYIVRSTLGLEDGSPPKD
ncbi:Glycosyl transferase, family 2 [Magnetospirillum sp. LM-5]|uniref:glycosyltransferase family 2 protein n=1 Tax=Magnetospirillum sp. LM-5 TaxID=2681466 RepID=UPI0013859348|nr:glycosyltransferase family 2 protein [Magnetospirillum sp. LM-5]CAA7622668.1 Glycosyl transferase, family 2 [Magnetospirillum sp. LM-5]